MSRHRQPASLGELIPLAAVEPDGLLVTTTGRWVRLLEAQRVPNTITADESRLGRIEKAFADACRAIPDHGSLSIYRANRSRAGRGSARARPRARRAGRPRRPGGRQP